MLDRSLIPPAESFYLQEFGRLPRRSRGWVQVCCCFHEDKHPSLSLNLSDGHFYCHGCGSKGGDVIAFLQLRYGYTFSTACQHLGCWTNSTEQMRQDIERKRKEQDRIRKAAEFLRLEEKKLRLELRDRLHFLNWWETTLSDAMRERESERLWELLSAIPDCRRRALAAHDLLTFGSAEKRAKFVLDKSARERLLSCVIETGGIRGDEGAYFEVAL